ncbi:MAG: TetR/AcrR family transcriptional regulator [Pseudomonadota bacterium]
MARTIAKDHDEKRGAILGTATRFFAQVGYDRASMSQLAVECGVSKALIYHYYDSKETILFDILSSHLNSLLEVVESVNAEKSDPDKHLHALVMALLESYRGADFEHRLQLESMGAMTAQQQKYLSDIQKQIIRIFSDTIAEVRPAFFVENRDQLFPATMSLFAMLNWFYQWHRPHSGISRSGYASMATQIFLGGLDNLKA